MKPTLRQMVIATSSLLVIGAGCAKSTPIKPVQQNSGQTPSSTISNSPTSTSTKENPPDASGWRVFQEPALGLEIRYPKEWGIQNVIVKSDPKVPGSKGLAYFGLRDQVYMDPNMLNFGITPIDSDLEIEDFQKEYANEVDKNTVIILSPSELSKALKMMDLTPTFTGESSPQTWGYANQILLKDGKHYFIIGYLLTGDSKTTIEKNIDLIQKALLTIHAI